MRGTGLHAPFQTVVGASCHQTVTTGISSLLERLGHWCACTSIRRRAGRVGVLPRGTAPHFFLGQVARAECGQHGPAKSGGAGQAGAALARRGSTTLGSRPPPRARWARTRGTGVFLNSSTHCLNSCRRQFGPLLTRRPRGRRCRVARTSTDVQPSWAQRSCAARLHTPFKQFRASLLPRANCISVPGSFAPPGQGPGAWPRAALHVQSDANAWEHCASQACRMVWMPEGFTPPRHEQSRLCREALKPGALRLLDS
jgi:hypothetical protein